MGNTSGSSHAEYLTILLLLVPLCWLCNATNVLDPGAYLNPNEALENGDMVLIMQDDCNLVLYDKDGPIWASGTTGEDIGCKAYVDSTDGELSIVGEKGYRIWHSETEDPNPKGSYILVLQKDHNLVVYGPADWSSESKVVHTLATNILEKGERLTPGESLKNGDMTLTMQDHCNLVLYDKDELTWASNTTRENTGCHAYVNSHGELCIDGDGETIWHTESEEPSPRGTYILVLQKDHSLDIYGPESWSSGTRTAGDIGTNILEPGKHLNSGESLTNGALALTMQADCNLVLFDTDKPIWSSETKGKSSQCYAYVSSDNGLLTIVSGEGERGIVWQPKDAEPQEYYGEPSILVLQKDRNLVVYGPESWYSDTEVDTGGLAIVMPTDAN